MTVPFLGGMIASIIGIATGAIFGVAPQVLAYLASIGITPPA
ncbi:MAG: hypothetical protein QOG94_1243 [Solirubrobacteraceae bacterium]|jgi:hypothetical protein|nr:hypothetical protein [Solirubrobacteraceae bacterium]MEA2139397.1 hypothetical protein [Solirubrobacteraceae bacterium]